MLIFYYTFSSNFTRAFGLQFHFFLLSLLSFLNQGYELVNVSSFFLFSGICIRLILFLKFTCGSISILLANVLCILALPVFHLDYYFYHFCNNARTLELFKAYYPTSAFCIAKVKNLLVHMALSVIVL